MSRSFRGNRTEDPLETRLTPRVGADFPVEICAQEFAGGLPGRTRDLSVGGSCIATASPFNFKSVSQLVIQLPGQSSLRLRAHGCWQREEPSAEFMLTGFAFENPGATELETLWSYVLDSGKYLAKFLYEHSEMHELGLEEAMSLAQMTRYRDIPGSRTLYRQNSDDAGQDSIYLVIEGTVILQVRVRDTREIEIARLGPGQFFGGLPILADVPHAESALTGTDVRLLEIDRAAFQYIRTAKPWLGYRLGSALLRISAQRLSSILSRIQDQL